MKKENKTPSMFLDSTIRVIARYGMIKATTRNIADDCGLNDSLIFRFFESKESMYREAFVRTDEEFYAVIKEAYNQALEKANGQTLYERCKFVFDAFWETLLKKKDKCIFYSTFYYSPMFTKPMRNKHVKLYENLVKSIQSNFGIGVNGEAVMHSIFDGIINMALKAIRKDNGVESDSEKNFKLFYAILKEYDVNIA